MDWGIVVIFGYHDTLIGRMPVAGTGHLRFSAAGDIDGYWWTACIQRKERRLGFAFVGRQVRLEIGDDDFYVDLLFYHLRLRSYVVIELKAGAFKAEYAGKMNFYLNAVDEKLRHEQDNSSIGLILCQDKNKTLAEYALRGMKAAIGVSEYQLTRALPRELQSSLPSIEEIEKELGEKKRRSEQS